MSLCAIGTPSSGAGVAARRARASAARACGERGVVVDRRATAPRCSCAATRASRCLRQPRRSRLALAGSARPSSATPSACRAPLIRSPSARGTGRRRRPARCAGWRARSSASVTTSSRRRSCDIADRRQRRVAAARRRWCRPRSSARRCEEAVQLGRACAAVSSGAELEARELRRCGARLEEGQGHRGERRSRQGSRARARNCDGPPQVRSNHREAYGLLSPVNSQPCGAAAKALGRQRSASPASDHPDAATPRRDAIHCPQTHVRILSSLLLDRSRHRPRHRQHADLRARQGHRPRRALGRRHPPRRRPATARRSSRPSARKPRRCSARCPATSRPSAR